jgi:iron complex transport system substrate-binding protein
MYRRTHFLDGGRLDGERLDGGRLDRERLDGRRVDRERLDGRRGKLGCYGKGKVVALLLVCLLLLVACGSGDSGSKGNQPTPTSAPVLDAYGTPITFPQTAPQRIISLVPSISDTLASLHLQDRVVAVDFNTKSPADLAAKPKISDELGHYNVEQIVALHPDLVLSYGGNTSAYDSQLAQLKVHVVDLPLANFSQSLEQILVVGRLTKTEDSATRLVQQLQGQVSQIKAKVAGTARPKVLLEADDSVAGKPFVFGGGSFGDEMLQDASATNIFHDNTGNSGYPQVTDEAIIGANPQYVILTEDPAYGGNPDAVYKRANWGSIDALKLKHVYHINVSITQHPGPRLVEGLQCFAQIIHPDKFSEPLPDYCSATV